MRSNGSITVNPEFIAQLFKEHPDEDGEHCQETIVKHWAYTEPEQALAYLQTLPKEFQWPIFEYAKPIFYVQIPEETETFLRRHHPEPEKIPLTFADTLMDFSLPLTLKWLKKEDPDHLNQPLNAKIACRLLEHEQFESAFALARHLKSSHRQSFFSSIWQPCIQNYESEPPPPPINEGIRSDIETAIKDANWPEAIKRQFLEQKPVLP